MAAQTQLLAKWNNIGRQEAGRQAQMLGERLRDDLGIMGGKVYVDTYEYNHPEYHGVDITIPLGDNDREIRVRIVTDNGPDNRKETLTPRQLEVDLYGDKNMEFFGWSWIYDLDGDMPYDEIFKHAKAALDKVPMEDTHLHPKVKEEVQPLAKWENLSIKEADTQAQLLGERLRDELGITGMKVFIDHQDIRDFHRIVVTIPTRDDNREIRLNIDTDHTPPLPYEHDKFTIQEMNIGLYDPRRVEPLVSSTIYDLDGDVDVDGGRSYNEIFTRAKAALDEVSTEDYYHHPKRWSFTTPPPYAIVNYDGLPEKDFNVRKDLLANIYQEIKDTLLQRGDVSFKEENVRREVFSGALLVNIPLEDVGREFTFTLNEPITSGFSAKGEVSDPRQYESLAERFQVYPSSLHTFEDFQAHLPEHIEDIRQLVNSTISMNRVNNTLKVYDRFIPLASNDYHSPKCLNSVDEGSVSNRIYETDLQKGLFNGEVNMISTPKEDYIVYAIIGEAPEAKWQFFRETILKDPNTPTMGDRGFEEEFSSLDDLKEAFRKVGIEFVTSEAKVVVDNGIIEMAQTTDPVFVERHSALEKIASTVKEGLSSNMGIDVYDDEIEIRLHENNSADIYMSIGDDKTLDIRLDMEGREGNVLSHAVAVISSSSQENNDSNGIDYFVGPTKEPLEDYSERIYELASTSIRSMRQRELLEVYAEDVPLDISYPNAPKLVNIMGAANEKLNAVDEEEFEAHLMRGEILRAEVDHTNLSFEDQVLIYAEPRNGNIQNMRFNRIGLYYSPRFGHGYTTGITDYYDSIEELKDALRSEGIEFVPKAKLEQTNEQQVARGSDFYEGYNAGHFNGKYVGKDQVKALREEQKEFVKAHPYGFASEDIETLNKIFPVKLSDQEDGVHLEASAMDHTALTDDVEISVRDQFWSDLFRMVDVVDGNLTFFSTNVESLGNIHKITGDLNANDSQLRDLGELREVGGSVSLDNSYVESLGNLEQVGYNTPNDRYLNIGWCPVPMEERLAFMQKLNIQEAVDYGDMDVPYTEEYGLKYIQDHIEQHDQDLDELYALTQTKPNREDWDDDDKKLERDVEIMKKALANVLSKENRERYTKYYIGNDSYLNAIVGVVDRRVNGGNSNVHLTPSSNDSIVSYVFDVRDVPAFGGALYLDFERNLHYGSSPSVNSMIKEVGITLENNNSDLLPKIGAQIRETYTIAENEEFSSDELVSKVMSVVDQYQTALREQEKSLEVEQKTNNVMPPTDSLNTSNSHRIVDVNSPENTLKGLDYDKIMDAINSEPKNIVAFRVTGDDDLNDLSKRGYEFYGDMVYNVVINLPEVRDNVTTYRFEDGRTLDHLFITAEQMEKVMQGLAYSVSSDEGLVVTDSPRQNPTSEPRVRIQSQDEIFLDDIVDVSTLEEVHDIIDRQVEEALANDLAPWKDAHLETWVATNVNNVAQAEEQSQQAAIQLPLVGAKITINSSIEDLPETSLIVKSVEYNEQSDVYVIKSESGRDDIYMKPDTLRSILENGQTNEQIDEDFYLTYSYSPPLAREQQQGAEVQETQASTQQETQQHVSQIGNAPANRHMNESEYIERVVSGETLYLRHPLDLDDAEFDNILHVDPDRKDADLFTLINRKGERLTVEKLDLLESLFDTSDERILLEFDFSGDMAERIASINRELSEQYKGYTYQTADTSAIRVDEISTYLDNDKLLVAVSDGERTYENIPFNEFFMSLSQQRMMSTTPVQEEKNDNTLSDEELNAAREFFKNNPRVGIVPPSDFSEPSRYVSYTEVLVTDVRPSTTYHNRYTLEGYMNGSRPQSAYSAIEMTGSQLRKMMAGSKTINAHDEVPTRLKVIFNSHLQDENLIKNSPSDQLQDGTLQYYDISAYSSKSPLVRVVDPQLKTEHVERWDESKLANAIRAHSLTPLYNGDLQNLVYNTYGGEGVDFSLTRKFNARGVDWNNLSQENLEASLPLNFKAAMEKVVSDLSNNQDEFPELYGRVSAPTYTHNVYDNGINEIVVGIDVNTQGASEDAIIAHLDLSYITTPSANLKEDNAQLLLSFEGGPYKQSQVESVGIEKPSSLAIEPLKGYSASLKDIASFVRNCDLGLEEQIADQERRSNNLKHFKNSLVGSTIGIYYDDSNKFVEYDTLSIEDKGENLLLNLGLKDNNSPQLSILIDKGLGEIAGKSVPDYWETTLEGSSEKIHIVPTQEYRDRFLLYSMIDKPLVATSGEGRDVTIRELVPPQVNPDGSLYRDTTVKYIEDGWHESNAFVHEVADWLRQGAWKEKELPLPLRQYADHLWSDVNTIKLIEKEDSYELYDIDASIANARLGIPLRQVTMKDQNGVDEVLTVGSISKERFNAYAHALRLEGMSLQIVNEENKQVNTLSSVVNEDEIRQNSFALMEYVKENMGETIPFVGNISNQLTTRSDGSVRYQSGMLIDNMLMRVADDYMKIGEDKYLHTAGIVELFDMSGQENADVANLFDDQDVRVKDFEHNKEAVLSFVQNSYNDWLKQTKYNVSDNGYLNSIIYAVDHQVNAGNSEVYRNTNTDYGTEFILESPKFGNPLYVSFDLRPDGQIEKVDVSLDVTDRDVKLKTGTPIRENYYVGADEGFSLTTLLDKAKSVVEQYQTALKDKEAIVERQKEEYKDILANIKDFNKKGEYQLDNSEFDAALKSDDVFRLNTPDDKVIYFYSKQWEEPIDYEYDYYFRESGEVSPHNFQDLASVQRFLERRGFTFGDGEKVRVSSSVQGEQEESTLKSLSDPEEIAKKLYDSLRGSTIGSSFRNAFREQSYYEGVVSGYESTSSDVTLHLNDASAIYLTIDEAKKILEDHPSQVELSKEKSYNGALILSSDVMDQYLIGQYVGKPLIPANAEGPWAGKEYTIQKYIPLKGGTIEEMDVKTSAKETKEIFGEFESDLARAIRKEELVVKQRNLPLELETYRANIKDYPLNTVVFVEDENNRGMFVAFGDDVEKAKTILSKLSIASVENSEAFETKPNLVLPFMNAEEAAKTLVPHFKEAQQPLLVLSPTGYGPTHVIHLPAVPNGQIQERTTVDKKDREFTSVNFEGKEYELRVVYDNEGERQLIAGDELRNALEDGDDFVSKEAEELYEEIFYFTDDYTAFKSTNEELYEFLREEHPDYFVPLQEEHEVGMKQTYEMDSSLAEKENGGYNEHFNSAYMLFIADARSIQEQLIKDLGVKDLNDGPLMSMYERTSHGAEYRFKIAVSETVRLNGVIGTENQDNKLVVDEVKISLYHERGESISDRNIPQFVDYPELLSAIQEEIWKNCPEVRTIELDAARVQSLIGKELINVSGENLKVISSAPTSVQADYNGTIQSFTPSELVDLIQRENYTDKVDYEFNEAIEATKDNRANSKVDETLKNEDNTQSTSSNEVADKADYAIMGKAIADMMVYNRADPTPYILCGTNYPVIYGSEETKIPALTAVALATNTHRRRFWVNVFIEEGEGVHPELHAGYRELPLRVNVYDENNKLKPINLYNISSIDWGSDKEVFSQLVDKYYIRDAWLEEFDNDWTRDPSHYEEVYGKYLDTMVENLNLDHNVIDKDSDSFDEYIQISSLVRQLYFNSGSQESPSEEEKNYDYLVNLMVGSALALKLNDAQMEEHVDEMIKLLSNPEIVERLEKDVNPVFDLISRALEGEKIDVEKFKAMAQEEQREESVSVEETPQENIAEEKPRCHDRNIPEYNVGGDLNLEAKALAIDLAFCATYDNPIALTDKYTEQYGGVRSLLYYNGANKEDFTFTYDTPHGEGFYNKHTILEFLKELNALGFKLDKEAFVLPETFTEMGKMRTLAPEVARAGLEEVRVALDGQNLAWKDLNGDGDIDANEVRVLDVSLSTDEKKYVLRVEDVNNKEVSGDISIDTAPLLSGVRQHTLKPLVEEEKVLTPEEEEVIALKQYHTQAAEVIVARLESTDDAKGYFINKNESSVRNETFLYPSMKSNLLPFSSLLLALASENKDRQTNGYIFFTSAQYNKAHVLAEEKGTIVTVENKDGSRRRATLFNLDQTALQPNDEAQYNKIVADKTGNATDGLKPSVMLEAFREMGVKLRQSADTDIYYDVKRDIINFTPKPESYTPQDKENLLYALVSATGAPSRLSREGLQKNASNDEKRYEELVGVLTVARIAEGERQPMRLPVAFPKDYWVEELRANPEIVERLEKDVNAAHNMVQSILSHRGIELNAQVAEDPTKRFFISDQVKALVDKESQRFVVIADKNTKMADVIVPAGASPNTDGKKEGFDKSLIESALASAEGKYRVQKFYNKQGMYVFNQEDTYFINKEVSLFIQDKGEVTKAATLNIDDATEKARTAVLEKVQMVRSEDHAEHHTWDMFIKPADGEGFLIRPSKEDTHEFFNALHNNKDFENVRLNLGLKYFGIAQSAPEEKKALLEVDTTGMDLNLIKGVREFKAKSGDIYARVAIEGVDSLKPRKVTPEQWQRLYLADDRKEYRKFLAAKLFGDVLRAQTEKVAEEKTKAQLTDEAMKVINRIDDIQKDYPNTYVAFRNKEDGGYDMYQDREKGYVKMFGVDEISDKYVNKNNIPLMLNHANDLQLTSVQEGPLGSRDVILTDLEKEGARDERFYSPDSIWQHLKAQPLAKEDKVFIISSDNRAITYAEDAVKMNERLNRETEDYITHFVPKEKGVEDSYDYLIITKKDGSRFTDEDVNYLYCENRELDDIKVEVFDYGKYYRAVVEKENENVDKLFTNSLYYKSVDKAVDINRTGFYMAETIYTWQEGKDNYALRINGVQGEEDYLHLVPSLHGKVDDIVIHPTTDNPLFQNVGMRPLSVSIAKNVKVLEFSNVKVTPIEDSVRKQLVETPEIDKWLKAHPTINVTTSLPKTYDALRASHPEALILFHQTGGYVAFGRDAEEVAKVTGFEPVTINERSKWEEVKLASFFGNNSLDDIFPKLIRHGNRVAVAEWPKEPSEVLQQQDGEMRSLKAPFNNPVEESPSRSSGLHR